MTANQRDSQAVNVNHPDLVHRVQCKLFKLLYLGHFLTDLLRVFEQNNQRNYGYKIIPALPVPFRNSQPRPLK